MVSGVGKLRTQVTAGTSASALSCDKNNHGHHKPLCACKGKKAGTPMLHGVQGSELT